MVQHYASHGDVQTAASISSLFTNANRARNVAKGSNGYANGVISENGVRNDTGSNGKSLQLKQPRLTVPKWWTKGLGSPYHTVHGSDTQHAAVHQPPISESFFRQHRSNSWSDSLDDSSKGNHTIHEKGCNNGEVAIARCALTGLDNLTEVPVKRSAMLDPCMSRTYDRYKKSYAEILYRWGYLQQRCEILKSISEGADASVLSRNVLEFDNVCAHCDGRFKGPFCTRCKTTLTACAVCRLPAKGLTSYCSNCGHGGHSTHMQAWFRSRKVCPTGCGCACLEMSDL